MTRATLYARFSSDKQKDVSIEDQFRACERAAASADLTVVSRYEDRAVSGGTADRPGYQALLAAARSGEFEVIVAEDISRLWRNRAEFGARSAELEDLGIHLVTCVGDDTRRDGWGLMAAIKSAIAEHYRREISYRTRRGLEGVALAGKPTGGVWLGRTPEERALVTRIFTLRARGMTVRAIAAYLNRAEIPAFRGGRWHHSAVSGILANRRYLGEVRWGRTEGKGGARDSRQKRRVVRSGGPLVTLQQPETAIITQELWDAAHASRDPCKPVADSIQSTP